MISATLILNLFVFCPTAAQDTEMRESPWQLQASGVEASLRGLHVLSDDLVWASGSGGTVLKTTDGGKTWRSTIVPGAEELDFRDVHAFDESSALILSAGTPARVYRTDDGGKTWSMTFEHANQRADSKAFFDSLSFWNDTDGIAMSDPVDDRVLLIETDDGGKTWSEMKLENRPKVIPGEGGFAASGTNMVLLKNGNCLIALGSAKEGEQHKTSRIAISADRGTTWNFAIVPVPRSQSSGIFSLAFANNLIGVAVGGDYLHPKRRTGIVAVTIDGGKTWKTPSGQSPSGYRSGVAAYRSGKELVFVAVGTNGTDRSSNNGVSWTSLSDDAFHAVQFSPTGNTGWATGADGRIGKWVGTN